MKDASSEEDAMTENEKTYLKANALLNGEKERLGSQKTGKKTAGLAKNVSDTESEIGSPRPEISLPANFRQLLRQACEERMEELELAILKVRRWVPIYKWTRFLVLSFYLLHLLSYMPNETRVWFMAEVKKPS